jgi:hypothetical protein
MIIPATLLCAPGHSRDQARGGSGGRVSAVNTCSTRELGRSTDGRGSSGHLLDARLIDGVHLPAGLNTGGEPGTPLSPAPWRGRTVVRKRRTGVEQGVIFEHLWASGGRY